MTGDKGKRIDGAARHLKGRFRALSAHAGQLVAGDAGLDAGPIIFFAAHAGDFEAESLAYLRADCFAT